MLGGIMSEAIFLSDLVDYWIITIAYWMSSSSFPLSLLSKKVLYVNEGYFL